MNKLHLSPLANDLAFILNKTADLWESLRNKSIFISGGTGFFGKWLLESIAFANAQLDLNLQALILSRNSEKFANICPHLYTHKAFRFFSGDVRSFIFPEICFDYVIHAATDVHDVNTNSLTLFDTIIQGTQRILEFTKVCNAKALLLVSSGAVYGNVPGADKYDENFPCQLNLTEKKSAYALGKTTAEKMACLHSNQFDFEVKIARCFSFVGPYFPLNSHYAIINFIRDGLFKKEIVVHGDGTAMRSYLYPTDLITCLWKILLSGKSQRPYNVGSDSAYSINEIANLVGKCFDSELNVKILQQAAANQLPERYIPDITRIKNELGFDGGIGLTDAIQKTIDWYILAGIQRCG